jgi:integrase
MVVTERSASVMRTLLRTAQGDRLETLYALAITTGLRQGELFGLKWEDVDLGAGRLSVRQTLTTPKGDRKLGPPKRSKSRRSVKLTAGAVEALRNHRKRHSMSSASSSTPTISTRRLQGPDLRVTFGQPPRCRGS